MRKKLSYQAIADFYSGDGIEINKGTIYDIHKHGHEPHNPGIRQALGLPTAVTMYPCISCGILHPVVKKCKRVRIISKWEDLPVKLLRKAIEDREEML